MTNHNLYQNRIKSRTKIRFLIGIYPRLFKYIKNYFISGVARRNGAKIGRNVTLPYKLARIANSNLIVGDCSVIQTSLIDLRSKVNIGSNVIIGRDVEILTCSHNIDSSEFEFKSYGIEIDDFCWVATRVFILPSCRKIGFGAVCGAGAVVTHNIESMSVVGGNPATHIKVRKNIHSNLVVESLMGNDLKKYIENYTYKFKQNEC